MVEHCNLSHVWRLWLNANSGKMRGLKLYLIMMMVLVGGLCPMSVAQGTVSQSFSTKPAEASLSGMSVDMLWDQANTAYANGNYIEAERMYDEILARNLHSLELYYNLGNLHYKRGEIGLSLLYYYKALKLSPADKDILHNISVVSAFTTDHIEQVPRFFMGRWSDWVGSRLSSVQWSILSLVLLVVALAALMLYLLSTSLSMRRSGFFVGLCVGVLFVLSMRHAIIERDEVLNPSEAIIMSKALSVTSSPNHGSTELFILHEGTKVKVLTTHGAWCEIVIDDGKKGWVEASRIALI